MRALPELLATHREQPVPVLRVEETLELATPVGVGALGHDEEGVVLVELGESVEAGASGRKGGDVADGNRSIADELGQMSDVLRRGAAAPPHHRDPVFLDESPHRLGEGPRAQRIGGLAVHQHGQSGVGNHRDVPVPVSTEERDVRRHLHRPGGAVEPETRDGQHAERVHRGPDVGAQQHGARGLDRDRDHDRDLLDRAAALLEGRDAGVDRAPDLQEILTGLDEERVDVAVQQPPRLLGVAPEHRIPVGVAETDQLGARAHRAEDEPRLVGGRMLLARRPGELGPLPVQTAGEGDHLLVELRPHQQIGPEGVGLDAVGADLEEALVDPLDHVRSTAGEDLRAVLAAQPVLRTAVRARLEAGAHGAVDHEDSAVEFGEQAAGGHGRGIPRRRRC